MLTEHIKPISPTGSSLRVTGGVAMKQVFTTTEAARACHISKQKIANLFDEGKIGGFRIPGSKATARRIPRA